MVEETRVIHCAVERVVVSAADFRARTGPSQKRVTLWILQSERIKN